MILCKPDTTTQEFLFHNQSVSQWTVTFRKRCFRTAGETSLVENVPIRSGVGDHGGPRVIHLGLLLGAGLPAHVHGGGAALRYSSGKYVAEREGGRGAKGGGGPKGEGGTQGRVEGVTRGRGVGGTQGEGPT